MASYDEWDKLWIAIRLVCYLVLVPCCQCMERQAKWEIIANYITPLTNWKVPTNSALAGITI